MLSATATAIIMVVLILFLLILIPLLDGSKRWGKYISLRYTLVAVFTVICVGCVLDFSHLADSSRDIVLMGGVVLIGLFVLVRSLEKIKLGGKSIELEASKGDLHASARIQDKENTNEK